MPLHQSAPYLRAKLYLCRDCIGQVPKHPRNARFECGCAWNDDHSAYARPPDPSCAACSGTGLIRDNHHYIGIKKTVGSTNSEHGRHGHSYNSEPDPLLADFPTGGWQIDKPIHGTGNNPGRPKTTIDSLAVTQIYLVDVANEVAEKHVWILEIDDPDDFAFALGVVTDLLFAKAPSANPRVLASWLPMSKTTIYKRRNRGERMSNFFEQMDRIESMLQRAEMADEMRWTALFSQIHDVDEEFSAEEDRPPRTKP